MRRALLASIFLLGFGLVTVGPALAAFESASGGSANPSALAPNGGTDYSVSITGKPATVDMVLVLDTTGSMANSFEGGTRWDALSKQTRNYLDGLAGEGFFARGGKVGLVFFQEAATGVAPTTDVAALKAAISGASPGGSSSCASCGLQKATELLAAIPNSSAHRRIAYVTADGASSAGPPSVATAVANAQAAGVERRVIGVSSAAENQGLEAFASSGSVAYAESQEALLNAYRAQTTNLPGATSVSWSFHLTPGFSASAPTASAGTATVAGGDVTWTLPSLGEGTATLSFHATHDPAAGCAATSVLSGTSFSDAEGDAAPPVGLGPVSISGCPSPPAGGAGAGGGGSSGPGGGKGSKPAPPKPNAVILLPKSSPNCSKQPKIRLKLKPPSGTTITKATVKVTGEKAKIFSGARTKSPIVLDELPSGHYKVTVTVKLSTGKSLTLKQSYVGCPASS